MAAANLVNRLQRLETATVRQSEPMLAVLVTENMTEEERAAELERSRCNWEANHGRQWPKGGRYMQIVLVGIKPEGRDHER